MSRSKLIWTHIFFGHAVLTDEDGVVIASILLRDMAGNDSLWDWSVMSTLFGVAPTIDDAKASAERAISTLLEHDDPAE